MKKIIAFISLLLCFMFVINSCKKCHPKIIANPCDSLIHTFSGAGGIDTMITNYCAKLGAGCHGAGSTNSGGPFTNYQEISGKALIIQSSINSNTMPPTGFAAPTAEEKKKFDCWINDGAPNN